MSQVSLSTNEQYAKTYAERKSSQNEVFRIKDTGRLTIDERIGQKGKNYDVKSLEDIPPDLIEVKTPDGWVPIKEWDFIEKKKILTEPSAIETLSNTISYDVSAKIGNVTMPDGSLLLRAGKAPSGTKPKFRRPCHRGHVFRRQRECQESPMLGKVKEWFNHVWEDATRTFQDLPNGPSFNNLKLISFA